ncbi:hypothetical protein FQN60_016183 [Etheostoma spectabile]|uniref:Uncharacterized protein n=1 Tax=Etheostoma spectabile TaxID=54343 RepID=A0A5J5D6X0_9PERO|nr:hypothetical protein FQN60_016183 [Etheostoma spectabile]
MAAFSISLLSMTNWQKQKIWALFGPEPRQLNSLTKGPLLLFDEDYNDGAEPNVLPLCRCISVGNQNLLDAPTRRKPRQGQEIFLLESSCFIRMNNT